MAFSVQDSVVVVIHELWLVILAFRLCVRLCTIILGDDLRFFLLDNRLCLVESRQRRGSAQFSSSLTTRYLGFRGGLSPILKPLFGIKILADYVALAMLSKLAADSLLLSLRIAQLRFILTALVLPASATVRTTTETPDIRCCFRIRIIRISSTEQRLTLSPQTLTIVILPPENLEMLSIAISYLPERLGVVHLLAVCELVHHDHLHSAETKPLTIERLQTQLDDLAGVQVAAYELPVWNVFFECHHADVVRSHNGVAYCCDAFEEVLRQLLIGSRERLDEVYEGIWALSAFV